MSGVLIRNVRLLDPASGLDQVAQLGLRGERIDYLGVSPPAADYPQVIDGEGLWLMPSAIDLAAHFREPGQPHKARFATEVRAAQAGGIGAVVLSPDTAPVVDTPAVVDRIRGLAAAHPGLDIHVLGALTLGLAGEALASMSALKRAGCIGVSQAQAPMRDAAVARRALEYANGLGLTVHIIAQDAALAHRGCAHEGAIGTRLGLAPIPVAAEVAALRLWISLVEDTGARVHFGRLSTARGCELLAQAQQRGLPVSADVAAHQLFLSDVDLEGFNAMAHVIPPLRSAQDRDALRRAVAEGVIASICSDHQPHEADAKINPFPLTEPGASGLELLLPLTLMLVRDGVLSPLQAAQRLSQGPAQVLGLPVPGLATGNLANIVLVDPRPSWLLDPAQLRSSGKNTPFAGRLLQGRVMGSWHRGLRVYGAAAAA